MLRVALAPALGLVLAACLAPSTGEVWRTTLPNGDAGGVAVVLRDETGLVTGIDAVSLDASQVGSAPAVRADPNDAAALLITWPGGCDSGAELALQPSHRGAGQYELHVSPGSPGGLGGGCAPIAAGRGIRVHTSQPIPVGAIVVNGVGP